MIKTFLKPLMTYIAVLGLSLALWTVTPTPSKAQCIGCVQSQCDAIEGILSNNHDQYEPEILTNWADDFSCYRSWIATEDESDCDQPIDYKGIAAAMMIMTEELTAVGMQQVFNIGKFLDAENQLETQRRFQELQFEAHRDYQPSEDFCQIGTTAKSLSQSEQKSHYNKNAMNGAQIARLLGTAGTTGADSLDYDLASRWENFQKYYCDPKDNGWSKSSENGLYFACGNKNAPSNPKRVNIDIDYTKLIEQNRTLDLDLNKGTTATNDEVDVMALSKNLYGHDILHRQFTKGALKNNATQHTYMLMRSNAARRNVAQNTFNAIASMKSAGSDMLSQKDGGAATYMYKIFEGLGVPEQEAKVMIGTNPSYFAQLEILSKKMYQNSNFFANLYDKPANIQRKSVALKAIDLMLDRAVFESELRHEMLLSVLLASRQDTHFQKVSDDLAAFKDTVGEEE